MQLPPALAFEPEDGGGHLVHVECVPRTHQGTAAIGGHTHKLRRLVFLYTQCIQPLPLGG